MNDEEKTPELLDKTYPANSRTVRRRPEQSNEEVREKKVEKVICGTVVQKKKGLIKKITETFIEDDTKSVGDYVIHDVLVPAAKSMVSDMVSGGIEMLLFGGRRGSRTFRDRGRSYVNYSSASYRGPSRDIPIRHDRDAGRSMSYSGRSRHDFDEIILETRGEAEEVLSHLVDLTVDYDVATVADLYDLVGVVSNFTDNKYGWTNLSGASVSRVRGGYVINLPRPQPID